MTRLRIVSDGTDNTAVYFNDEKIEGITQVKWERNGGRAVIHAEGVGIDAVGFTLTPERVPVIEIADLRIDPIARTAQLDDDELLLSQREFDLLLMLAAEPLRVFTKQELLQALWGVEYEVSSTRTLDAHVSRVRCKMRELSRRSWMICVWGVGYRLTEQS